MNGSPYVGHLIPKASKHPILAVTVDSEHFSSILIIVVWNGAFVPFATGSLHRSFWGFT